jgi:hypothetical protein
LASLTRPEEKVKTGNPRRKWNTQQERGKEKTQTIGRKMRF